MLWCIQIWLLCTLAFLLSLTCFFHAQMAAWTWLSLCELETFNGVLLQYILQWQTRNTA